MSESQPDALTIVLAPLVAAALLLFAAASISPAYVQWPRVAASLHAHRPDFILLGFALIGIAVCTYCVQLLAT